MTTPIDPRVDVGSPAIADGEARAARQGAQVDALDVGEQAALAEELRDGRPQAERVARHDPREDLGGRAHPEQLGAIGSIGR